MLLNGAAQPDPGKRLAAANATATSNVRIALVIAVSSLQLRGQTGPIKQVLCMNQKSKRFQRVGLSRHSAAEWTVKFVDGRAHTRCANTRVS